MNSNKLTLLQLEIIINSSLIFTFKWLYIILNKSYKNSHINFIYDNNEQTFFRMKILLSSIA